MIIQKNTKKDYFWLFSYGTLMLDDIMSHFSGKQVSTGYLKRYKVIKDGHLKCVYTGDINDIVPGQIIEFPESSKKAIDKYESDMYKMIQVKAFSCGNITGDYEWECGLYVKNG